VRRALLVTLLGLAAAWGAGSSSPRRTDLRFHTLGGAYTALFDHPLMAYYNPAGYAFLGRSSPQALYAMDDDDFIRPRAVSPVRVGLPSLTLSMYTGVWSNIAGMRSLLDLALPGTVALPAHIANRWGWGLTVCHRTRARSASPGWRRTWPR
jgi:hypothetical protein